MKGGGEGLLLVLAAKKEQAAPNLNEIYVPG